MTIKQLIPHPCTPDQFASECQAIYGNKWKRTLSEKMSITRHTINHWAAGRINIPGVVIYALNVKKGVKV